MRRAALLVIGLAGVGLGNAADGVVVRDAWSRATPPGTTVGVAYFVIDNRGAGDRLLRISTPIAKQAELHVSSMNSGVMKMEQLKTVDIKKNSRTTFAPGGMHVMLIGLPQPIKTGDSFPLTLTFAKAGSVQTTVRVLGLGPTPNGIR